MSAFKTVCTQTQWPRTGPADHQMTTTPPDYRMDPPELERDMPDAHLEKKKTDTICIISVVPLINDKHKL